MTDNVISQDLLQVLACPECKNQILLTEYGEKKKGLLCRQCNLIFPIKNGIPVMLLDEAIKKN